VLHIHYGIMQPTADGATRITSQQTRDHLFKHCSRWKDQQAQSWARVKEEMRSGKRKWRVGDLLADERYSPAVLDFLRTTYMRRSAPPVEENWDSDEEEEEWVVVAAGIVREEEEEEWVVVAAGIVREEEDEEELAG